MNFRNIFLVSIAACAVPIYFLVRHFEDANFFDSIGTWYTILVTVVFSAVVAIVVTLVAVRVRGARPQ